MKRIYVVLVNDVHDCHIRSERFEDKYKVQREYGLDGLKRIAKSGLKGQVILVSDELLCARCRPDSNVEEATQHIISLASENKVLLAWDDAQVIPTRKQLRSANILYENGTQVPLDDRYPWGNR